jgi:uncharacterized membrane protein
MAAALLSSSLCGTSLPVRRSRGAFTSRRQLVCRSQQDEGMRQGALPKVLTLPAAAAALAGIMMTSAVAPEDALAARSSGRMGGSSFKSAPRSAPRAAAPRGGGGSGPSVRNNTYNTYVAPPVGGYGYGGGWGGGISLFPRFYSPPIFGFGLPIGGFFNFLFTMFVVTTIFGVIRGALSKKDDGNRRRDDDEWD